MVSPDSGKIKIEDIWYRDGYRDAENDVYKIIISKLWEKSNLLQKGMPELALGIVLAIEEIEKLKND